MRRVMLVRHAEPQIEIDVPASDWCLTPRGIASTKLLATELAAHEPTMIIASPERKAKETAHILAGMLEIPVAEEPRFSEHGAEPGQFLEDYTEFRALVQHHFERPDEVVMRQESSRAAGARFAEGIDACAGAASVPVVVSHGRIMASWLGRLTGSSAWETWNAFRMPDLIAVDLDARSFHSIEFPLV